MLKIALGILVFDWAWTVLGMLFMGGLLDGGDYWIGWWSVMVVAMAVLWIVSLVIAGIGVIRGQRALYRCLPEFGMVYPRPGLRWATWGWFVPVACLWVPYQAFDQLAKVIPDPRGQRLSRTAGRWWLFWLVGYFVTFVSSALLENALTPEPWLTAMGVNVVGTSALIASGLLLIALFRELPSQYERRVQELAPGGGSAVRIEPRSTTLVSQFSRGSIPPQWILWELDADLNWNEVDRIDVTLDPQRPLSEIVQVEVTERQRRFVLDLRDLGRPIDSSLFGEIISAWRTSAEGGAATALIAPDHLVQLVEMVGLEDLPLCSSWEDAFVLLEKAEKASFA